MKKLLFFISVLILSTMYVYASDFRFVQVDSMLLSATDEKSISRMQNVIKDINNQKNVEFIIFSGDNIANPRKENLECFINLAKGLRRPYYIALGSKDINKSKLSKKEYVNALKTKTKTHKKILGSNYVVEKKDIVFIIVDGSKDIISTPMGYYKETTLEWLENYLSFYSEKNVVILQHYPLIPPSNKEMRYTIKPEKYLEVIKNYSNVKAVFAGNFDVNSEKNIDGVLHVTTANAPKYRIVDIMDYDSENPTFWSIIKE